MEVIRASDNRTLKYVRSLQQRKTRERERAFVVEGFRAIADALEAGARPLLLLVREDAVEVAAKWFGDEIDWRVVAAGPFDGAATTQTPQGAQAVFSFPELAIPRTRRPLYLVLDRVADPGNVGTLIRAAAGAGATAAILTPGTVDPFNPKVVRAAVGAHFRLPIVWLDEGGSAALRACDKVVVAEADGRVAYDEIDWRGAAAIVIGSEAEGVGDELARVATARARIPLATGVESLNAAVAGGVFLFEAARQRRLG